MYTLYLKTHVGSGLRYLGVTSKNPHTYRGSGLYWRRFLKAHKGRVSTKILFQTESKDDLAKMGRQYSDRWNVTDSEKFANLKPEAGFDGVQSPSRWGSRKKHVKQSRIIKKTWKDRRKNGTSTWILPHAVRKSQAAGAKVRWTSPEQRKLQSAAVKASWVLRKARGDKPFKRINRV